MFKAGLESDTDWLLRCEPANIFKEPYMKGQKCLADVILNHLQLDKEKERGPLLARGVDSLGRCYSLPTPR